MIRRILTWFHRLGRYNGDLPQQTRQQMLKEVIARAAEHPAYDLSEPSALDSIDMMDETTHTDLLTHSRPRDDTIDLITGGTTGDISTIPIDRDGYSLFQAYTLWLLSQYGWRPRDRVARIPFFPPQSRTMNALLPVIRPGAYDPGRIARTIASTRPAFIWGHPRVLVASARLHGGFDHSPKAVIVTGEILTPTMRDDLESAFDTDVINLYGASEVLWIGKDDDGTGFDPVPCMTETRLPDEPIGQLQATSLANTATPIIRYRPPDLVRVDDGQIQQVLGRQDHVLHHDGRTIYPAELVEAIYQQPDLLEFKLHPGNSADLEIELYTAGGDDLEAELNDLLARFGLTVTTRTSDDPLGMSPGCKKRTFARCFPT